MFTSLLNLPISEISLTFKAYSIICPPEEFTEPVYESTVTREYTLDPSTRLSDIRLKDLKLPVERMLHDENFKKVMPDINKHWGLMYDEDKFLLVSDQHTAIILSVMDMSLEKVFDFGDTPPTFRLNLVFGVTDERTLHEAYKQHPISISNTEYDMKRLMTAEEMRKDFEEGVDMMEDSMKGDYDDDDEDDTISIPKAPVSLD